jgi:hypothetical protein
MSMVKVTYDDGHDKVVVTWTPEYGVINAGPVELLANFTVEVIEPQVSQGPTVAAVAGINADIQAQLAAAVDPIPMPKTCVVCNHDAEHVETGCTANGCECMTAVYP